MPDEKKPEIDDEIRKRDAEIARYKKLHAEREDEVEKLKGRLAKFMDDEDKKDREKDKMFRSAEDEKAVFTRQLEQSQERIAHLEKQNRVEKFGRKIDELASKGWRVGDAKQQERMLNDVVAAPDPDERFEFLKSFMQRDPVGVRVDQRHAVPGAAGRADQADKESRAADAARDICLQAQAEGKVLKFEKVYEEQLARA